MGIDFSALLDHTLPWDELVRLDAILDAEWRREGSPLRTPPVPVPRWDRWCWALTPTFSSAGEELFACGHITLDSPTGFGVTVFRRGIELSHLARWWSFLCEDDLQDALRLATSRIAHLVRATTIIYLPDSTYDCSAASDLLYEEQTIADVRAWLLARCGPPAARVKDIYKETGDTWSGDSYFVEELRR